MRPTRTAGSDARWFETPDLEGDFEAIDRHLGAHLERICGLPAAVAALVSRATREGHTCIDLRDEEVAAQLAALGLDAVELLKSLSHNPAVFCPGDDSIRGDSMRDMAIGDGAISDDSTGDDPIRDSGIRDQLADDIAAGTSPSDTAPLVLDAAGRLFLRRYWEYEQDLARGLLQRLAGPPPLDSARLEVAMARLFPGAAPSDRQAAAARAAAAGRLGVISGGPGTGKTTTVARILALLLEMEPSLAIALGAPTGKAADRLQGAVAAAAAGLDIDEATRVRLPRTARTLHRLLGISPRGGTPRFNPHNPLPFDVVVVDEASMVDVALMSRLVAALRDDARLILLGDRDQLASVEAGYVFGDICAAGGAPLADRPDQAKAAYAVPSEGEPGTPPVEPGRPGLGGCIVELRHNYRFGSASGIGALSAALRTGDLEACRAATDGRYPEVVRVDLPAPDALTACLQEGLLAAWSPFFHAADPVERFAILRQSRVLCPLRRGPYGVETINELMQQIFARAGLIQPRGWHYHGRPIMITRNAYDLELYNGDVGVILADGPGGDLKAFFERPDGPPRKISTARLPEHETVYAMSVHKSQGSEFDQVLLIVPPTETDLVNRELLYTGVTRARARVEIWIDPPTLATALTRSARRNSGLLDALTRG